MGDGTEGSNVLPGKRGLDRRDEKTCCSNDANTSEGGAYGILAGVLFLQSSVIARHGVYGFSCLRSVGSLVVVVWSIDGSLVGSAVVNGRCQDS